MPNKLIMECERALAEYRKACIELYEAMPPEIMKHLREGQRYQKRYDLMKSIADRRA